MNSNTISEAIQLYREAGRLFSENKRIAKEVASRFQGRSADAKENSKPSRLWVETATRNASEIERMLKRIIALGEESEALCHHKVYALAHRNLGLYFPRRFKSFHEPFPTYMDEAAGHLNIALSLGVKRDRKVSRALGAAYYQSGKFREAVEPLKESIQANPEDGTARYHLCLAYLSLHEREKAREQYEALKQNPASPEYHLVKMLEPMMESSSKPVDEAERELLRRQIENFRRIRE